MKWNRKLRQKLKIFGIVGIVGLLITGAFATWVAISAVSYVAAKTDDFIQSPITQEHVEHFKSEINELPKVQPLDCGRNAQSLLAVRPWLERPALDILMKLKAACFEEKQMNPVEGEII